MPIIPPRIDDRNYEELVEELISRIPAHTPEWTHHRIGDPGRTQLELFAWLADSLLYRANLIPEKQRLTFLSLLGMQMQPAIAATGLVKVQHDDKKATSAVSVGALSKITGPVNFETRAEMTVLPVQAQSYYKRKLDDDEKQEMQEVLLGLKEIYSIQTSASPYVTTSAFIDGKLKSDGLDLIEASIDNSLWLALVANDKDDVETVRETLGGSNPGETEVTQRVLNIGVMPLVEVPALFEESGERGKVSYVWEISTGKEVNQNPEYLTLDIISDTSSGFSKRGVQRVLLPGKEGIGAPDNDVRNTLAAGVGNRPPRIDDPEQAEKLVCWLRLRPVESLQSLPLSWVDINAIEIDQRETIKARIIGQSDGSADQSFSLSTSSIEKETFQLQVEEAGYGYVNWQMLDQLAIAGRDDAVFSLDSEAGVVTFGDGVRGRIPDVGMRVRVVRMRSGGGEAGNLPVNVLNAIRPLGLNGEKLTDKLKVVQSLPTDGGKSAETLNAAEKRIPAWLQHRNRAVTESDYRALAVETPGVRLGRIELLPRFLPHQRRNNVPGVVSVMVLPYKSALQAPNPRPDRPIIEKVYDYLSARKPLATELYVIGCEYVSIALSVSFELRDGFGHDEVVNNVRQSLKNNMWSLAPYGPQGSGWPLGKTVSDRELEVVVARVDGVEQVNGVNLFIRKNDNWQRKKRKQTCEEIEIKLKHWQLPELMSVIAVVSEDGPPEDMTGLPDPFADSQSGIAVPVVPEVC